MGTWGRGLFDNDSAADFMMDLEEAGDIRQLIESTFEEALEEEYLDSDSGCLVVVAAAYVDRQLNGTIYSDEDSDEPLSIDLFPENSPSTDLRDLKGIAVQALTRVLGEHSELNELWLENEEEYPTWRKEVADLLNRLS